MLPYAGGRDAIESALIERGMGATCLDTLLIYIYVYIYIYMYVYIYIYMYIREGTAK